jgi:hypothetical protein
MSPRSEELDDFLPSAGEDERLRLVTLELRRTRSETLGEGGTRDGSEAVRGDFVPGDCGSGVFAAT